MLRRFVLPALLSGWVLALFPGCSSDPQLVWHEEQDYRWAELPNRRVGAAGFEEIAASRSGMSFVNTLREEQFLHNRHLLNGSGVAVGDYDGDGRTDVYFARLDGPNVLYRNLGGWRFEDVTQEAGVDLADRFSTGAVFADVDGDRHLDLIVTAMGGPNALLINDGSGRFKETTEEAGLYANMGSTSIAVADVDGDGDLDLYVANYKVRSATDIFPPQERRTDRLIERNGDSFRIAEPFDEHYALSEQAGGLMRVERAEPDLFYRNDGGGRFTSVSLTAGAFVDENGQPLDEAPEDWTLTARFQDANGDGVPDLYICNDFQSPDYFWLGDGTGGFRAVPHLAVRKTSFSTMSVDFSDIDRDGHLDFFLTDMLSRDYTRRQSQVGVTVPMTTDIGEFDDRPQVVQNTLFRNRGDDTYAEIARLSGVAASDWTWSGLFLDVDLDGYEDLLLATGHAFDVLNLDAQNQEIMRTGSLRDPDDFRRLLLDFPDLYLKNAAFRNTGDLNFEFMPNGWGLGDQPDVSTALAFGDFDNDGYTDVVMNRLNGPAGLFRNRATAARLAVRLKGRSPNTQGVGAKIRVSGGGLPIQEKEVVSGGQYLSGSDPTYTFAAGDSGQPLDVEVLWRSGARTSLDGIPPDRVLEIMEPSGTDDAPPADAETPRVRPDTAANKDALYAGGPAKGAGDEAIDSPLFEDESSKIDHRHFDAPFRDFDRQPLLPLRLGQMGPAVAWADLNGDRSDDLIVGTGRGGKIAVYLNEGGRLVRSSETPVASVSHGGAPSNSSRFSRILGGALDAEMADDASGIVALPQAGGGALLFAGVSNYENASTDSSWIHLYEVSTNGQVSLADRLPFGRSSVGPLALVDVDGDGDLDLFAGGRLVPGRYPEPADSRIYVNDESRFRYDSARSAPFRRLGMISGAAFGDLDGDGRPDLVAATEWGPIRYFENDGGDRFVDRTADAGLDGYTGRWNGVALGDFDGDGRLDVVATNWGWNGVHERLHNASEPLRLYYDDFDANGTLDVVKAHFDPALGDYVPDDGLAALSHAMPYLRHRMATFQQFATATLREVIGPKLERASYLEAGTLSHMLFLNPSSGTPAFKPVDLPVDAQAAPAFAAVVGDFDADGQEDLFLSQNFFALPVDVPRQDAGRGLLLRGNGRGEFMPVAGSASGIAVYGEQRAAAVADYDGDGRLDLVVGQNGTTTRMYRNVGGAPGLRVGLDDREGNPVGIGSVMRLKFDDGSMGPARIVSAGTAYWSQHAAVQVMGRPPGVRTAGLHVRWPDGAEAEYSVPPDARQIFVSPF